MRKFLLRWFFKTYTFVELVRQSTILDRDTVMISGLEEDLFSNENNKLILEAEDILFKQNFIIVGRKEVVYQEGNYFVRRVKYKLLQISNKLKRRIDND